MKKINFKNFLKLSKGLTLTEILVTIAIIIILSGLVIANSGAGKSQLALSRSANKLAQDLRKAQEMAMSAKECPEKCPIGTENICDCAGVVPDRYGIGFNANSNNYFLFADRNNNGNYQEVPDVKIETMYVEKGVSITELLTAPPPNSPNQVYVSFKPPDPLTEIRDPGVPRLTVEIILKAGEQIRKVIVNEAGLISVE